MNTAQEFWDNVDIKSEDECWIWQGGMYKDGYGGVNWFGKTKKAHRLAWELMNGEIPEGLQVLHDPVNCSSKKCVNPNHLRLGTLAENHQDSDIAKLTWSLVHLLRKLYKYHDPEFNANALAIKFGLKKATVYQVVTNRTWKE